MREFNWECLSDISGHHILKNFGLIAGPQSRIARIGSAVNQGKENPETPTKTT